MMLETKDTIIYHIPKTGGHALGVMASRVPKLLIKSSFKIKGNRALSSGVYKHSTLSEVRDRGKRRIAVLRHLPTWLMSVMWHQSLHTVINSKGRVQKFGVGKTYFDEMKKRKGFLFLPEFACQTVYPDSILRQYLDMNVYLRMENLAEDFIRHMNIDPKYHDDIKQVSTGIHGYEYDHDPQHYWTKPAKETLYKNNPLWTNLEKEVYGHLL